MVIALRKCPLSTHPYKRAPVNSGMAPFKLNHMATDCVSTVKWNTQCNCPDPTQDLARIAMVNWSALEAAMIVWKYILLSTCLGSLARSVLLPICRETLAREAAFSTH